MQPHTYKLEFKPYDYSYVTDLQEGRCHVVLPAAVEDYSRFGQVLGLSFCYSPQQRARLMAQVNKQATVRTIFPRGNVTIIPWDGNRPPESEALFIDYLRSAFRINQREIKSSTVVLDFRDPGFNTRYFERHFRKHFTAEDLGSYVTRVWVPRDFKHDQEVGQQVEGKRKGVQPR